MGEEDIDTGPNGVHGGGGDAGDWENECEGLRWTAGEYGPTQNTDLSVQSGKMVMGRAKWMNI